MMRPGAKRGCKTKTSIVLCKEKFCCPSSDTEASFYCEDCNNPLCSDCDASLHDHQKYRNHIRQPLTPPSDKVLCRSAYINVPCLTRNFADIWCQDCQLGLCFDCYESSHNSGKNIKRKSHKKISFAEYERRLEKSSQEDCSEGAVKPLSPIGNCDDSLTYVSCPQHFSLEESTEMSFTSVHSDNSQHSIPDLCQDTEVAQHRDQGNRPQTEASVKSFRLVDENETILLESNDDFVAKLGCDKDAAVKIVSIFGNTGDGKSHTLNHTFFNGEPVFQTSEHQDACTIGVWAAYDPNSEAIVIDTEGFLGATQNENQRTRLLLKVLAVSDVVIYRTRAERLTSDMFSFLGGASKAYLDHFTGELTQTMKKIGSARNISNLGPAILVFHETQHTAPLAPESSGKSASAHQTLSKRFADAQCKIDAFSDLRYCGTQTRNPPTDFGRLRRCIKEMLRNNNIRAPRKPEIVFLCLKSLNDKFSGKIDKPVSNAFPDQYFTCPAKCEACGCRCSESMNHIPATGHKARPEVKCQYKHDLRNQIFLCKNCHNKGKEVIVVPKTYSQHDSSWVGWTKFLWAGYILECENCGIIYQNRKHWFGNEEKESVIHTEIRHVWPEGNSAMSGSHNTGRKVLDGLSYVAETISSVSAKPTRYLSEWTADQIAPTYWVPNSRIINCGKCEMLFTSNEQKHHCRACGGGFCDNCSSKKRPVPERGWGEQPVRVCDACYEGNTTADAKPEEVQNTARKVGEVLSSTFGVVYSALEVPLATLKNTALPEYWVPDHEITDCCVCKAKFGPKLSIHHCRACGKGVCQGCSQNKCPVPLRGWDYDVRVCDKCFKNKGQV